MKIIELIYVFSGRNQSEVFRIFREYKRQSPDGWGFIEESGNTFTDIQTSEERTSTLQNEWIIKITNVGMVGNLMLKSRGNVHTLVISVYGEEMKQFFLDLVLDIRSKLEIRGYVFLEPKPRISIRTLSDQGIAVSLGGIPGSANWNVHKQDQIETQGIQKDGMRKKRKERALLFKKIKDANPQLTYEATAIRGTTEAINKFAENLKEKNPALSEIDVQRKAEAKFLEIWGKDSFSTEDVRNDVRATDDWNWERGDRIR